MSNPINKIQEIIYGYQNNGNICHILKAGCGSLSKVKFASNSFITGIDISQTQLDRNIILNLRILGDIQSYSFNTDNFDIIICWHVLEHLQFLKKALLGFFKAVKKDGLIILPSPNPLSIKGLIINQLVVKQITLDC